MSLAANNTNRNNSSQKDNKPHISLATMYQKAILICNVCFKVAQKFTHVEFEVIERTIHEAVYRGEREIAGFIRKPGMHVRYRIHTF